MKFVKLRTKLARKLWQLSVKLVPLVEDTKEYKSLPDELKLSQDAAVEADGPDQQWQPEQHGNVVVVEPDLMFQHRRGKF